MNSDKRPLCFREWPQKPAPAVTEGGDIWKTLLEFKDKSSVWPFGPPFNLFKKLILKIQIN
jgi:hypothetical protein